ncbi:MAG: DsrE family protein [Bacteroidetes bacterium]|nr:DsrE family protein [Bacteroidota bacterium]
MNFLIILNDAPYGNERPYNALRLALQLQKEFSGNAHSNDAKNDINLCVFLMGDAVGCAVPSQETPTGYYNIERMLKIFQRNGGKIKICGTCAEARGLKNVQWMEGAEMSNLSELTKLTVESEKVFTF